MAGSRSTGWASSLELSDVFVAEHYLAGADPRRAETLTRRLRASEGRLRYALFLPADETYFAVYESPSLEAVRVATAAAASSHGPLDRIVPALLLDPVRNASDAVYGNPRAHRCLSAPGPRASTE